jgi:hypothetical protein
VLRRTRADVITANFASALETLANQRFDLVVLCHTLSTEEMIALERAAQELQKGVRVLQVVSDIRPYRREVSLDAEDVSPSNPATLLDKVVRLLHTTEVAT